SGTSEIIVKSAVIPGGPKFGKTLNNLIHMAVVAKIKRARPGGTIVHPPSFTNRAEFDRVSLALQESWKAKHRNHYTNKHSSHYNNLKKFSQKSKKMVEIYRKICKEMESNNSVLKEKMASLEFLTVQQRIDYLTASPQLIKTDLKKEIEGKNNEVGNAWEQIDQFASVERSAWALLSPLLDGSIALSHIDGKLYAPQVPQEILKENAHTISKTGLSSVYRDGVLDLLSLVQFSNLCIKSISSCMENNQFHIVNPESTAELAVQSGRVGSMQETLDQVRENLDTLLARLLEDVAHQRNTLLTTAVFSDSILDKTDPTISITEGGPPQLCFPTPPIKLRGSPNSTQNRLNKFLPLSLTPGPGTHQELYNKNQRFLARLPLLPILPKSLLKVTWKEVLSNLQFSPNALYSSKIEIICRKWTNESAAADGVVSVLCPVNCAALVQRASQLQVKNLRRPNIFR
ncbi:unnamed protein product, partial [Meganyctiphanes norvegica]